jgi:hypothetical protein
MRKVMRCVHDLEWSPPPPALGFPGECDPDYPPSTRSFG